MLKLVLSVFSCGKPVVCKGRIERHAAAAGNLNGGSGHIACCAAGQEDDGPRNFFRHGCPAQQGGLGVHAQFFRADGLLHCRCQGKPGMMQVTRTLYGQYSPAKVLVRLLMADFKGPYKVLRPAEGQRAARELTLTMAPECCFFI